MEKLFQKKELLTINHTYITLSKMRLAQGHGAWGSESMGHECQKFHRTLADKISSKNGEKYEDIMRYIRVKISFLVLKATLLCLRGSRSIKRIVETGDDFGLCLHELRV